MSENKFIAKLKGEPTPKSVVEIQNDRLVAPFKSSSMGHIADRDSSVVVAKGAQNWAVNQGQLVPVADDYIGTESDLSGTSRVSGAGLWLNATYTFPATGDETNPVSAIIAPSAKWVLTLCGDSLMTQNGSVITLTMLVKIGATHLTTKQFKIRECASQFSQRLAIDFSESEQSVIKAHGGSPLTVQVLCDDEGASATIYSGMTHLTLLQRKIDADLVATDNVLLPEFIENLLQGYIIPADYFSNYEYLDQIQDGGKAMPEFTRTGDKVDFTGWAKPIPEVYSKTEIDDKFTVTNALIDANADAIQKTREDYIQADSDIMTIVNAHAEQITTNKNDIDDLGNQVAEIEAKIPESASETNQLVTQTDLTNKKIEIMGEVNESVSELQTQITTNTNNFTNYRTSVAQDAIDSGLQTQITANANKFSNYRTSSAQDTIDTDLQSQITAEQSARQSADTTLQNNITNGLALKLDKDQGSANQGKILSVGSDGQITLTTAPGGGLQAVAHNSTLTGAGTDASPLGIASSVLSELADKADQTVVDALANTVSSIQTDYTPKATTTALSNTVSGIQSDYVSKTATAAQTIVSSLQMPELTVGTAEGTLNLSITAGVATIATNNGLDIISQTKFDTLPTTDDTTTWANALDANLVRKAQVATAITDAVSNIDALPNQAGNAGKVLTTDGSTASWQDPSGGTTITLKEYDE